MMNELLDPEILNSFDFEGITECTNDKKLENRYNGIAKLFEKMKNSSQSQENYEDWSPSQLEHMMKLHTSYIKTEQSFYGHETIYLVKKPLVNNFESYKEDNPYLRLTNIKTLIDDGCQKSKQNIKNINMNIQNQKIEGVSSLFNLHPNNFYFLKLYNAYKILMIVGLVIVAILVLWKNSYRK